jgi:hypothetical protein
MPMGLHDKTSNHSSWEKTIFIEMQLKIYLTNLHYHNEQKIMYYESHV